MFGTKNTDDSYENRTDIAPIADQAIPPMPEMFLTEGDIQMKQEAFRAFNLNADFIIAKYLEFVAAEQRRTNDLLEQLIDHLD